MVAIREGIQGHRHPPDPPRRHRQGHRPGPVRRRHPPHRHALRPRQAQPARPRHHQEHRRLEGAGAARASRPSSPRADFPPPPEGVADVGEGPAQPLRFHGRELPGRREGALPRPRRRRRRGHRRPHRRGRPRPDRGRVRGAAAGPRRARGDGRRRADPARRPAHRSDTTPLATTRHRQADATSPLTRQFKRGDVEKGFAEADVVIEREFTTTMYHQGYIEPHNGTAFWNRTAT